MILSASFRKLPARIKTPRSSASQTAPMRPTNHTTQILICILIIAAEPLFAEVIRHVRDGRPVVDGVFVNGHGPCRFLVDTGSNVNLIETGYPEVIAKYRLVKRSSLFAKGRVILGFVRCRPSIVLWVYPTPLIVTDGRASTSMPLRELRP